MERIRRTGELLWGGDLQGGEPFVFEDAQRPGKLAGFEVEIAAAVARDLGARARFVQNDWSTLVPSLERGTFDVAMNGLEVTAALARRVHFSRPYYVFAERLTARVAATGLSDLASLRGRRVGTLASSLAWELLGGVGADRVPYEGVEEPYMDLEQGRIEAVLLDDIIASRYGRRPGLVTIGDLGQGRYAIGVKWAEDDLWRAVDGALARMIASGELRGILARWHIDGARQAALAAPVDASVTARSTSGGINGHVMGENRHETDGFYLGIRPDHVLLFVRAAGITLLIAAAAMLLAMSWGLLLAVVRMPSRRRWRRLLSLLATAYVELFRGTPVLLQLYVLYFALAPVLALPAWAAAVLGLGLNYAAYEAEVYRGGIAAVPRGQIEAAAALGMSEGLALRRVVLPQALRFSLPGVANDFIALLKDTSLVSAITVVELTKRMTIVAVDSGGWLAPGLLCAALYFAMSYPLSRLARRIEQRLGAGA